MSLATVDFPEPVAPTSATDSPASMVRSRSVNTGVVVSGYVKCTPTNSTRPPCSGRSTGCAGATIAGSASRTSPTRAAEAEARCAWATMLPSMRSGQMSSTT